jgi:hypothetical protein
VVNSSVGLLNFFIVTVTNQIEIKIRNKKKPAKAGFLFFKNKL